MKMTQDNLVEGAQSLAGLIDYQEGSVVSRALLSKSTGNITLFAFDKDQNLSEHTSPHDALVLSLDGELDISIEGDTHRLTDGGVILMPAGKPHAVYAATRSKMLLVMIRE
jgi:quercetin dioxygenase-like cupin family protein